MELQPSSFVNSSRSPETRQQQQTLSTKRRRTFRVCVCIWWSCRIKRGLRQATVDDSSIAANLSTCSFFFLSFTRPVQVLTRHHQMSFCLCWISIFFAWTRSLFLLFASSACASVWDCCIQTSFCYVTIVVDLLGLCAAFQVTWERTSKMCRGIKEQTITSRTLFKSILNKVLIERKIGA